MTESGRPPRRVQRCDPFICHETDAEYPGAGMARGDHIYVSRGRRYAHHGIDCGDGSVIHFVGSRGSVRRVARTPIDAFTRGAEIRVRTYDERLNADETIRNAESRIGSLGYHLVRNNCEHLATWCCTGWPVSSQVRRWGLATQAALASAVAAQTMNAHLMLLGTFGAGLYVLTRPLRGRRSPGSVRRPRDRPGHHEDHRHGPDPCPSTAVTATPFASTTPPNESGPSCALRRRTTVSQPSGAWPQ